MPKTTLLFYRELDEVPVLDWLDALRNETARTRVIADLFLLSMWGHELRRPAVENLSGGLYELRTKVGRENYRVLYFFFGQGVVVLTAGLTKERELRQTEIRRALSRKTHFEANPGLHAAEVDV